MSKENKYGFQKHLSPDFPSQVVVDTTEHCNQACIHCPHEDLLQKGLLSKVFIPIELHHKLIDEVAAHGQGICRYLRYTGQGETLMHPKIFEMLGYAVEKSGIAINVTTNGTVLGEKYAQRMLETGVHVVDISIDAFHDETYAIVRKGNIKLEKTRNNVLQLIELKKKGIYKTRIVVSFVEQDENKDEVEDFERFWRDAGADYVVIRRQHSAGGAMQDTMSVSTERYPCLYPWERLTLGPNGMIHFCPQDWVHGSEIADFRSTTIKDVWQGKEMRALREAHLNNDFSCHSFCGQCPDWSVTRWPDEGRSYTDLMQNAVEASTAE